MRISISFLARAFVYLALIYAIVPLHPNFGKKESKPAPQVEPRRYYFPSAGVC